jgi:hypothetical protein
VSTLASLNMIRKWKDQHIVKVRWAGTRIVSDGPALFLHPGLQNAATSRSQPVSDPRTPPRRLPLRPLFLRHHSTDLSEGDHGVPVGRGGQAGAAQLRQAAVHPLAAQARRREALQAMSGRRTKAPRSPQPGPEPSWRELRRGGGESRRVVSFRTAFVRIPYPPQERFVRHPSVRVGCTRRYGARQSS